MVPRYQMMQARSHETLLEMSRCTRSGFLRLYHPSIGRKSGAQRNLRAPQCSSVISYSERLHVLTLPTIYDVIF